jgi:hypothetical protein
MSIKFANEMTVDGMKMQCHRDNHAIAMPMELSELEINGWCIERDMEISRVINNESFKDLWPTRSM